MSKRGMKKKDLDKYIQESKGIERDYISEIFKSKKNAWVVSTISMLFCFLGLMAGVFGLYQKSPPPYVLRVNESNGKVEMISTMQETEYSYGEAVDKFFISEYITKRESYNYFLLQGDYNSVVAMSDYEVLNAYNRLFEGENSPDKVINNDGSVIVEITGVVLNPDAKSAQVHFKKQFRKNTGEVFKWSSYIATVSYRYVNLPMTEQMRLINPLGFRVVGYRVDAVLGG